MKAAPRDDVPFDMNQQLLRIDTMQAEIAKIRVNTRLAPFTVVAVTVGVTTTVIAAGAVLAKLIVG